ncbi:hypothetical protein ACSS6W_003123 [Trichoderma asperelloides]
MGDSTASGTRSCDAQRPLTMRHSKSRAEPSTWASRVCDSEQKVHVARTENAGEASEGPEQTARSRSSRADANFLVSMSRRVRVEDIPEAKLWDSSAVPTAQHVPFLNNSPVLILIDTAALVVRERPSDQALIFSARQTS